MTHFHSRIFTAFVRRNEEFAIARKVVDSTRSQNMPILIKSKSPPLHRKLPLSLSNLHSLYPYQFLKGKEGCGQSEREGGKAERDG